MIKLNVAGVSIAAEGFDNEYFKRRTADYTGDFDKPDMTVRVSVKDFIARPSDKVYATRDARFFCETQDEYIFYDMYKDICVASVRASKDWSEVSSELIDVSEIGGADTDIRKFNMLGEAFRYRILEMNGIVYHSSTIIYDNSAVLFTADSGTGKSTHTELWKKHFGAEIINDDSPAIRCTKNGLTVFGTPWSGKTEFNINAFAPMMALVFLERSEVNFAERITYKKALPYLVHGMMTRPVYKPSMEKALAVIEQIAANVPLYKLGCNISREACEVIKNKIFG